MRSSVICLFLCYHLCAMSQTAVKKVIVDTQKTPLVGAVVACLDADGKLLRGSITNPAGEFSVTADFSAKEWLQVSYLGYETQNFRSLSALPDTIVMKGMSKDLEEVVVQGKSIVTQKSDRLIFHIANSNLTKGNNTMQLLRFTPLMQMNNENITMLGKSSIQLYINGKKSNMNESSLQNYLRSLPAEKVERIELITDPGSEYRVDNNEGIVNLILKKDESQGWKGTFSLFDQIGYYNNYGGSLYLDYQKNKLNFSLSGYGLRYHENYQRNMRYDYMLDQVSNKINQTQVFDLRNGGVNLNMDYNLSKDHRIGMIVNAGYFHKYNNKDSRTDYTPLYSASIDSTVYSEYRSNNKVFTLTANLNYRWLTDSKGSSMTFDVDYVKVSNEEKNPLTYTYTTGQENTRFTQNMDIPSNSYSAKWEYTHIFNQENSLKIGMEGYHTKNQQDFFYGDFVDGNYISDVQKTNSFELKDYYGATYAIFNRTWSSKFMTTLGVRMAYLNRKGISHTSNEKIKNNDLSFIPSIALSYNVNENHQLSYTLTSNVIYPYYTLLNPFRFYESPTIYRENDPEIEKTQYFSHAFRYVMKQHYIFILSYLSSPVSGEFHTPAGNGYTKISTKSFGNSHILQGMFNWNDSFWNNRLFLNTSLTGQFYRSYGHLDEYKIDVSDFSYTATINWGVLLSKRYDWHLDGSVLYRSKNQSASLCSEADYWISFSLRKNFKNDISVKLGLRNLFYKKHSMSYFVTENYTRYYVSDSHPQKFTIDVSIPFGRKKVQGAAWKSGASSTAKSQIQ